MTAAVRVLIGAAVAFAAAPAHARTTDGAGWLDEDAPVVVSIRPPLLSTGAELLARTVGAELPELAAAVDGARAGSVAAFGVDLFTAKGWSDAGFDPAEPVLISLAAIDDAAAERVYDRLFDLAEWSDAALRKLPKTYWRSRAVIRITDAARAERTVRALVGYAPDLFWVGKKDAAEIAMLLGGSERKREQVVKRLRKRKLVAIGWLSGLDSVISFRIDPRADRLVVDVVGSFAGVPNVWSRDSNKLLAQIERNPGTSKLPAVLARGAGADALASDLAVWVQPNALIDLAKATGRHRALQALAGTGADKTGRRELHREASSDVGQCERFRPLATKGPFADVAFTLDLTAASARGRTMWGLRKAYKLAAALLVDDDGLHRWDPDSKAMFVGAHYLRSLAPIRALPRPAVARGFGSLDEAMRRCGSGASVATALFGWPALVGAALDELRAQDPALEAVVDGARNGALVIEKIGARELDFVVAGALSFDRDGAAAVGKLVESALGAGTTKRAGNSKITLWDAPPLQAFRFAPGDGVGAFGFALGTGAAERFVRAAGASATPPIARWSVDAGALFAQIPDVPAAVRAIAERMKRVTGQLAVDGASLVAEIELGFR